jgi:hypothetical protein
MPLPCTTCSPETAMTVHPTRRAVRSPRATRAALALALLGPAWASAETNPYYLGVSESINHDSNLYRLGDGRALPASIRSKADTSFTTALIGGIDQNWGRQHVSGSMALRNNRYQHNDQLNYNGYGLNLGWDWATVNNLSGNLNASADSNLRRFDSTEQGTVVTQRNVQDSRAINGTVRLGVVTRLTAEASASHRTVDFSADAYRGSAYRQNAFSLGGRYEFGGRAHVGLAWRDTRTTAPRGTFGSDRQDVDVTGYWSVSDRTNVNARLSHTSNHFDLQPQNNFSGVTGELQGSSQVTGKLRLQARLARDTGLSYSLFNLGVFTSATNFNRTTTEARLNADYALSAKVALTASAAQYNRDLSTALTPNFVLGGSDRTTLLSVGARWTPTRSMQVGCQLDDEKRRTSGNVGVPYSSVAASCYGQFTIQ